MDSKSKRLEIRKSFKWKMYLVYDIIIHNEIILNKISRHIMIQLQKMIKIELTVDSSAIFRNSY